MRKVIGTIPAADAQTLADLDTARKAIDATLKTAMEIHTKAAGGLIGALNVFWNSRRNLLPPDLPPNFQIDYATGELFVEVADAEMLLGSATLAATIDINGRGVQLGEVVVAAHQRSMLTVEQWNALPEDQRDLALAQEIAAMRAAPSQAVN